MLSRLKAWLGSKRVSKAINVSFCERCGTVCDVACTMSRLRADAEMKLWN